MNNSVDKKETTKENNIDTEDYDLIEEVEKALNDNEENIKINIEDL